MTNLHFLCGNIDRDLYMRRTHRYGVLQENERRRAMARMKKQTDAMKLFSRIKKNMTALSLAVVAAAFCVTGLGLPGTVTRVCAEEYEDYLKYEDSYGIFYYEENADGELVIQGYERGSSAKHGTLLIPAVINGKKVAEIGQYAFEDADGKERIVVPYGIERIGYKAIGSYYSDTYSIQIPSSVTDMDEQALLLEKAIIYCDESSVAYRYALENGLFTRPYAEYSDTAKHWDGVELEGEYMRDYTGGALCP